MKSNAFDTLGSSSEITSSIDCISSCPHFLKIPCSDSCCLSLNFKLADVVMIVVFFWDAANIKYTAWLVHWFILIKLHSENLEWGNDLLMHTGINQCLGCKLTLKDTITGAKRIQKLLLKKHMEEGAFIIYVLSKQIVITLFNTF